MPVPSTGPRWRALMPVLGTAAPSPVNRPSLMAIAAFCRGNGHHLNIEIKPSPGRETETGAKVAIEAARLWAGAEVPPLLSSFQPESLAAAQDAMPSLPRALLFDALPSGWFEAAQKLGCIAVVTHYALMDAALIDQLHAAGMRALAYTVNDPAEVQRLCAIGIDSIITDAVDRFSPASHGA